MAVEALAVSAVDLVPAGLVEDLILAALEADRAPAVLEADLAAALETKAFGAVVVASEAAHHSLVAVAADLWAVMEVVELIEATFFADVVAAVAVVMVEAGERTKSKELCIAPSSSFLLHKWNT